MRINYCSFTPNHIAIQTQHVYANEKQVFIKKVDSESEENETNLVEWFPTNFQWQPLAIYPPPLYQNDSF